MANITEKTPYSEREEALIAILSRAFEGQMLDARIVDVHKQEGGMASTLRFTLNEEASADLERDEIEASGRSIEDMAADVAAVLRSQLVR